MKDFSCFFTKWDTFCYFFLKNSCKRRNIAVSSKSWEFWLIRSFFVFFHEMGHLFWNFLLKSSSKRRNVVICSKGCKFWPNRWFHVFPHDMRHFFQVFGKKFGKTAKHGTLFEKLRVLSKWMNLRVFSRNEALFPEKFMQTPKRRSMFEELRVLVNSTTFRVFSRNEALFATFSWKVRQKAETW